MRRPSHTPLLCQAAATAVPWLAFSRRGYAERAPMPPSPAVDLSSPLEDGCGSRGALLTAGHCDPGGGTVPRPPLLTLQPPRAFHRLAIRAARDSYASRSWAFTRRSAPARFAQRAATSGRRPSWCASRFRAGERLAACDPVAEAAGGSLDAASRSTTHRSCSRASRLPHKVSRVAALAPFWGCPLGAPPRWRWMATVFSSARARASSGSRAKAPGRSRRPTPPRRLRAPSRWRAAARTAAVLAALGAEVDRPGATNPQNSHLMSLMVATSARTSGPAPCAQV